MFPHSFDRPQFSSCDVLLLLCSGRPLYGHSSLKVGGAVDKLCRVVARMLRHRVIHRKDRGGRRRSKRVRRGCRHLFGGTSL